MRGLWQDVVYSFRILKKARLFSSVAVITVALGIGSATAVFSILFAVVLRPLSYRDPDRLVVVWEHNIPRGRRDNVASPANFLDWRSRNGVFERMAVVVDSEANLVGSGEPEKLRLQMVSASYLGILGVQPVMGRDLQAEDDRPGIPKVVLLSFELWARKFGSDPGILGRSINLNGAATDVVGILPPGFLSLGRTPDILTPAQLNPAIDYRARSGRFMRVVAKLNPGVPLEQAQSQMSEIARQLEREHPDFNTGWGVHLVRMQDQFSGEIRDALWILMGAVALVLLIAAANVASLLLARASSREREIAIRASLGAGRARIMRQLLTESVTLALLGGALGCGLAYWAVRLIQVFGPAEVPRLAEAGIDWTVLGFSMLVTVGTGILSGFAPAWAVARASLAETIKETTPGAVSGTHGSGWRSFFVVAQVALAVMLLVASGLLIQSFAKLTSVDPGFAADNVLTMSVSLPPSKYPEDYQLVGFFKEANERLGRLPGVVSAGSITFLPFTGLASATDFRVVGRPEPLPGQSPVTDVRIVQPGYFATLRIPLKKGRLFTDFDNQPDSSRTFVVNETLVKTIFPGEEPIGKRLIVSMGDDIPGEIVGIVGDTRHASLEGAVRPMVYYPQAHLTHFRFMTFVLRTAPEPESLTRPALAVIRAMDPELPVSNVRTLAQWIGRSVAQQRFQTALIAMFSLAALILSMVGIYGIMAYSVSLRVHEIGLRMAMGAEPRHLRRHVVRQAMVLVALGSIIGLAGAFSVSGLLQTLLYGIRPTDPLTYAGTALLLALAGLAAAYIPARRATRVDPIVALRCE